MNPSDVNCRTILEDLNDGVYFVDPERKITFWNKAAERITGFDSEEVIGRCCSENILVHVDFQGTNLCINGCPLAETLRDGRWRECEVFLHHKQGHRVPVSIRVNPLRDPQGRVIGAVEIFTETSPKEAILDKIRELETLAMLDTLTELANRRFLEIEISNRIQELIRYQWPFALIFIDIDHFKQINDRYGHAVGDKVLKAVANTLNLIGRPFDLVGRWGGDEFAVILRNVDADAMNRIAERFRALVAQTTIPEHGEDLQITLSLGGTLAQPQDTIASLVTRADMLMYRSKQRGRNRFTSDE